MKISTVAFNRFHIYDQARELKKHNLLYSLITNYPKFRSREFNIADNFVVSLPYTGFLNYLRIKNRSRISVSVNSRILKYLHNKYSKNIVKHIKRDNDAVIFLSSFGLEGINYCKKINIISISDHGSAHQEYERNILEKERVKFGLKRIPYENEWIIHKENNEFELVDYIFLGSHYAKDTFTKLGFNENKLIVNNYGVNLSDFKKIRKNDDVFRIIFVGGVHLRKGIHYLIKAFNELNLTNSELWIIGGGYPNKEIDLIFNKMNINFNNVYFKGMYPQNELYRYYSQGSLFCLPSLSDGFGMVVPQALACGLPVIVSENTGAKDIVIDGYNGYIIPTCSIEAIKEKIFHLYNNKIKRKIMSEKAIESVQKDLSWNDYGNRLTKHLKLILN